MYRNIFPVEITEVDKDRNMIKIHFKGYSEKFDEWKPCDENNLSLIRLEQMSEPTDDSLSDRLQALYERVYREIKRKVCSGRREDPEIRIEIPVDKDVFNEGLGRITSKSYQRNKLTYEVLSYGSRKEDLNNNTSFITLLTCLFRKETKAIYPLLDHLFLRQNRLAHLPPPRGESARAKSPARKL